MVLMGVKACSSSTVKPRALKKPKKSGKQVAMASAPWSSPQEAAERIVEGAVKDLLAPEKAQGTDRIIYTGQLTLECRADNLKNGIPVDEGVWSGILSLL